MMHYVIWKSRRKAGTRQQKNGLHPHTCRILSVRNETDSRYVIERGKRIVVLAAEMETCPLWNQPVFGRKVGTALAWTTVHWYRAIRAGFGTANIDRGTRVPRPSPAVALSTVLLCPRDICLVRCQICCMQDNWVVLSHPHDKWQPTKRLAVTLKSCLNHGYCLSMMKNKT